MPATKRLLIPSALLALAAAAGAEAGDWKHTLVPYVWASGMDGKTAIGPVEADVDINFGDILDNLDWGGMLSYRGERSDGLVIMGDVVYMDLEADKTKSEGPISIYGKAEVKQLALEGDIGWRVAPQLIAYGGFRYNDLDSDLTVVRTGPGPGETRTPGLQESWVDPIVGAIGEFQISDNWSAALRGDMGGFGWGSDFAWQAMGTVRWQATPSLHVVGGYRYIHMDYDNGSGLNYFRYDMAISGPVLGVAFTF